MYKYKTITEITDNGPYITKVILFSPEEILANIVDKDTFSVYVERKNPYTGELFMASRTWLGPKIYPSKGYRIVLDAYPCDEYGNKVHSSKMIALEMAYGPVYPLGYAQAAYRSNHNEFIKCEYRITQIKDMLSEIPINGLVFDDFDGDICFQLKGWRNDISHYDPQPLRYGYFTPDLEYAKKNFTKLDSYYGDEWEHPFPEKFPLVIWLHGAGEGGEDPTVAYTGNKVVNLSSDDIQRKIGGAAYVLAPQAPTFWMDDGIHDIRKPGEHTHKESRYTEGLKALIDEFIDIHEDIDRDRIYIGGCSNGGFMTMKMVLTYPDFFAAAYPVCEAYRNSEVTDQDIENIKNMPIWFTQAENDPLVPPESSPLPIYLRLKAAGAENVHMSLFENIIDQTGLFKDDTGKPYEYSGHFSWVHVYNDFCMYDLDGSRVMDDGRPVTLWRWIGRQRRK